MVGWLCAAAEFVWLWNFLFTWYSGHRTELCTLFEREKYLRKGVCRTVPWKWSFILLIVSIFEILKFILHQTTGAVTISRLTPMVITTVIIIICGMFGQTKTTLPGITWPSGEDMYRYHQKTTRIAVVLITGLLDWLYY